MKRILTTLSQKWPEYLLEILVITSGILGAFALNNWNENIGREARRTQAFDLLLTELSRDKRILQIELDFMQSQLTYLQQIKTDSARDLDSLNGHLNNYFYFRPSISKYESLKQTGDLNLIEGELLNAVVSHYENSYQWLQGWSDYHRELITGNVEPYMLTNIPIDENQMADSTTVRKQLKNFQLINLINAQIFTTSRLKNIISRGIEGIESLNDQIERELGNNNDVLK